MNTKCSIITGLLTIIFTFSSISQEIIEKNYFDSQKSLEEILSLKVL